MVTNLLSLSPDNGASLENKLGSSILKINRSPTTLFKRLFSRSFTKNTLGPHFRNSFFIDQVPRGVWAKSGASFQNRSSTPSTCTFETCTDPSGVVIIPRERAMGATTACSSPSLANTRLAKSSSKKPSGESSAMSPLPIRVSAKF